MNKKSNEQKIRKQVLAFFLELRVNEIQTRSYQIRNEAGWNESSNYDIWNTTQSDESEVIWSW